jgi:hypothetical protein
LSRRSEYGKENFSVYNNYVLFDKGIILYSLKDQSADLIAMLKIPELTQELADNITKTAQVQLRTSRMYKMQRMAQIAESEDLYFGVVPKSFRNPFNDSFPFMSGFVDTLVSKLDDPPEADITPKDEADYMSAKKYQAAFNQEVTSTLPHAKWALKDRWCRKQAIFSGVGVYSIYGENREGTFVCNFNVVDYYDFHCEPAGGGNLENHLFCGEESIFKTKEELMYGAQHGYYDAVQVAKLTTVSTGTDYKQNQDEYNQRLNRHRANGLDPQSNNYTGQELYKFVQWLMVYGGVRWYVLFEERTGSWIRIKPLSEMFPVVKSTGDALWPYVAWHTHEDARVFWGKAPADDARPIAKTINRLLNQELYNREKRNHDQRFYDPEMFYDVEALQTQTLDGLIPFDSKGGNRRAQDGIYKVEMGEITGTIDMVSFLDAFNGTKTGTTPGSQGAAPQDQKVGIYFGELKQIEGRLGLYNKSYREAWEELVYRFIQAIDMYVTEPMAIEMFGEDGLQWGELSQEDKKRVRDFGIKIRGGHDELQENQVKNQRKIEALKMVSTVNPRWKDEMIMRAGGFENEELRDAFNNLPPASKELLAEAEQAIDDIARGKKPKVNAGANLAFMQRLIDEGLEQEDAEMANKIYDYAMEHALIVAKNEARTAQNMINQKIMQQFNAGVVPAPGANGAPKESGVLTPAPAGGVPTPPGLTSVVPSQSQMVKA